jgi:hypothetical protein
MTRRRSWKRELQEQAAGLFDTQRGTLIHALLTVYWLP